MSWNPPKFRPVDGQVIFLHAGETDKAIDKLASGGSTKISPMEYFKMNWDITSEYSVEQIHDCMLRSVTERDKVNGDKTKKEGNLKVGLVEQNIPTHMHNSGITTGGNVDSMRSNNESAGYVQGETAYDMFYNDSFSTGMDDNEIEGTVDEF